MYIHTFNEAMRQRFGKKMYRLSLDCGFGCPNRDGTKGVGGCIFCSATGAGNFAEKGKFSAQQIEAAKKRIQNKAGKNCGYIAYFQSYTNTYAPTDVLRALFEQAIQRSDICALAIATRPDCISDETLALLAELNRRKPVWVELGLQTANDKTGETINRCFTTAEYDDAITRLRRAGIETVTHIIIGLPGETLADYEATVRHAVAMHTDGVKIHLLHILKNTQMEQLFLRGDYTPLSLEEYTDILCHIFPLIPKNVIIHRFTGDGDKKELVAPLWSGDKKRVLNTIQKELAERNIEQGSLAPQT